RRDLRPAARPRPGGRAPSGRRPGALPRPGRAGGAAGDPAAGAVGGVGPGARGGGAVVLVGRAALGLHGDGRADRAGRAARGAGAGGVHPGLRGGAPGGRRVAAAAAAARRDADRRRARGRHRRRGRGPAGARLPGPEVRGPVAHLGRALAAGERTPRHLGRRPVLRRPRRARRAVPRRGPAARRGRRRRVHRGARGVHAGPGARRHVPARRPRRHPRGAGGGVAGADGRQGRPRRGGPPVPGRRDAGRAGDPRAAGHPLPARRRAVAAGRRDRPAPHPGGPARLQPRPGARGAGAVDPPPHPALPAGPDQGPVRHRPQFGARHPAVPGGAHLGAPGAAGARGRRRRGRGRRRARSRRGRGGRGRRRRVPAPAAERLKERAMDFPFPNRPGVPLDEGYLRIFRERPLVPAVLPGGRPALLVTRHADVRTVLSDDRFSREAWTGGTLFARTPESLALAASDPPTHTRRRRAVQGWFTARRAEADRPRIEALAERLLDGLEKQGPPADLIGGFATPLPYTVICDMLDIPVGDLGLLLPWVSAMMSAGRFPPEEVAAAHEGMRGYFADRLAGRLARPGTDLLSALATASGLSADEIVVFGYGLLVAG